MRPAERIALITESARLLSTRDWPELDFVLRQFGLPWTDTWEDGNRYSYALQMLDGSDEKALSDLHEYLVGSGSAGSGVSGAWDPGCLQLFISHLAVEQDYAGKIRDSLSSEGVSGFVAHTSIEPSKEWQAVIEGALRTCDAMVVLLHSGIQSSPWCDQEIGFALARRVPILPVSIDVMPYGFLSKLQATKAGGVSAQRLAAMITDWLAATPSAQGPLAEGLVSALQNSGSFDQTRRLVALLQRMPAFTPDQLERLDLASRSNFQVSKANLGGVLVPALVTALIATRGGTPASAYDPTVPPF